MASTLRIKVSEEKYRETINKLGEKISELQECLSRLQNLKNKLSSAYTGPAAEKALEALQQNEQNVKTTLEKVQKQKEKIQQYIDSMGSWNEDASKKYEVQLQKQKIFSTNSGVTNYGRRHNYLSGYLDAEGY